MVFTQYSELCFKGPNIDELGACLIALGASGAVQEDPDILRCYVDNNCCNSAEICKFASSQGLVLVSNAAIEEKNWVALSSEVWSELRVGRLTIRPVADSDGPVETDPDLIRVIPGEGFGTGHHPSTRQALSLMQNPAVSALLPHSVIDVGTGSGILAIAAARIFDAHVIAYDIDGRALVNARENVSLNGLSAKIDLFEGVLPPRQRATLIIANIYAEVLLQYEQQFFAAVEQGGFLIMAGIMQTRLDQLKQGFDAARWRTISQLQEDGWCAALLTPLGG